MHLVRGKYYLRSPAHPGSLASCIAKIPWVNEHHSGFAHEATLSTTAVREKRPLHKRWFAIRPCAVTVKLRVSFKVVRVGSATLHEDRRLCYAGQDFLCIQGLYPKMTRTRQFYEFCGIFRSRV